MSAMYNRIVCESLSSKLINVIIVDSDLIALHMIYYLYINILTNYMFSEIEYFTFYLF